MSWQHFTITQMTTFHHYSEIALAVHHKQNWIQTFLPTCLQIPCSPVTIRHIIYRTSWPNLAPSLELVHVHCAAVPNLLNSLPLHLRATTLGQFNKLLLSLIYTEKLDCFVSLYIGTSSVWTSLLYLRFVTLGGN